MSAWPRGGFCKGSLAVVAAAVMLGSGCSNDQEFNGMGLISPVSRSRAEGELRGILVGAYHADPDDAACLAREAVMDSWSGKDPSVSIRPDWSKTQFERYAEICDIDLGDLWSNFD